LNQPDKALLRRLVARAAQEHADPAVQAKLREVLAKAGDK
jgi:hypothetical protein